MSNIVLPKKPVKAQLNEPKRMIIMAKPKVGKTTVCALLPNSLVINFEDDEQTCDGSIIFCKNFTDLKAIIAQIKKEGNPYDFGVIDTITKLEELAEIEGERIYMSTPQGKSWYKKGKDGKLDPTCGKAKYKKLKFLPNGSGYQFITEAMKEIDKKLKEVFPRLIYLAHVKETQLAATETSEEITAIDVNLTGKNKQIFAADAHAIGYAERIGSKLYIKFLPSADSVSGCKIDRLDGQNVLISEKLENRSIKTYWEEIFPSIKK